jgi:divinyl chlorophyllide a 8-vinyl-reductase
MPASPSSSVLLTGATGTAGRATANALVAAGHDVVAYGRRDPTLHGVTFHAGAVDNPDDLRTAFLQHRPQAVVSCLASRTGAPSDAWAIDHAAHLLLLEAAKNAGTNQFVLLSAICVQKPRLAFQHAKLAFEEALVGSGLTYSIVRPTALFKSLAGQLERVQAGKPYLMFGDGTLTACKPISDADLGRFMASCLTDPALQNNILPIGGPGPALTPHDMGAALFALTGQTPAYRRVPLGVLSTIQKGLQLGGWLSPRLRAKADLARIGHYYASESMLVWDAARGCYDADATPEFGHETLFGFYQNLIAGTETLERGDHAVF